MPYFLLLLTFFVFLLCSFYLYYKTKEPISLVFYLPFFVFFFLRPFTYLFFGFKAPYVGAVGEDELIIYQISGVVFCFISLPSFLLVYRFFSWKVLNNYPTRTSFKRVINIRFFLISIAMLLITYVSNLFRFDSVFYFIEDKNSFLAMMELAGGGYYLNYLSESFIFPILICTGIIARNHDLKYVLFVVLLFCFFYYFIAAPATRSWFIIFILAVFAAKIERVNVKSVVSICFVLPFFPILLYILNKLRQGVDVEWGSVLINSYSYLYVNFLQFENGILLIEKFKNIDWFYFGQIIPAMTPIMAIPSAILPWKPAMDKDAQLTDVIFGSAGLEPLFYAEGSTLTYTVPLSGYADFGLLGVAFSSFAYSVLCASYLKMAKYSWARVMMLYLFVRTVAGFRVAAEAHYAFFYYFIFIMVLMFVIDRVSRFFLSKKTY